MNDIAQRWLNDQQSQERELLLIVDRLAEPDPIVELFGAGLMQDYVNLYQGTEFADMAEVGPWLVRLSNPEAEFIQTLIDTPERDWGWLASAEHVDLTVLAQHWRDRMLVENESKPALYRFQDNRVIARHLDALTEQHRSILLGPITSALCWDGKTWKTTDNPRPGLYPAPFEKPWQEIAEPEAVTQKIQRHNLELWLWQNHSAATAQLAETQPLSSWLDAQLGKAKSWQWQSLERIQFLLRYQLDPALAAHPAWAPVANETADAHFTRSSNEPFAASSAVRSDQG